MKKILIIGFILLSVFLIYLGNMDSKVYYLALGDSLSLGVTPYGSIDYGYTDGISDYLNEKDLLETFIKDFSKMGYRTTDLIRDINDNVKIKVDDKEKTIKNSLIKADLVTISIGTNDILSKLTTYKSFSKNELYKHLDEYLNDLNILFELIRSYCKEDIIFIGYYNFLNDDNLDDIFIYLNEKTVELCNTYGINYIDIYDDFDNIYLSNPNDIHPNKDGYKFITDKVINIINKTLLD